MHILIINGPNLNLLGKREENIYGSISFEDYLTKLGEKHKDIKLSYLQSNHEGDLIDYIHKYGFTVDGIILNAGAYTHSSYAIYDAIRAVSTIHIEVHISNIHKREKFRSESKIAGACLGSISGFGLYSYDLAIDAILNHLDK